MPITVRHTPVSALGQLAVLAGQARGQQLQMGRDIQLTGLAMAAEDRAAAVGMAARDRTFAIQQAAASQMAKQRATKPDDLMQRKRLRQFVSEAEATGIYKPAQIKQMQIFAKLGDAQAVRTIAGKLPTIPARQQELQRQSTAVAEIGKSEIAELQKQLDAVNNKLGKRFTPGTQRLLRERPEFMETVSPDVQELLAQQQQLQEQIGTVGERTARMGQMLQLGLAVPEQMALESRREAQVVKQEETEQRQLERQIRETGKLTDREELAVDVMRDQERDRRTIIGREITHLSKDLPMFEGEDAGEHTERIGPVQAQIRQLELERVASFAREKTRLTEFLGRDKKTITQVVTDSAGQQWRFTGRYRNGKPIYEAIE